MSETSYQILVNGGLVDGFSEAQARANMASLFKVDDARVAPMFSGRKLAIKKGLSKEAALKYKAAINRAGMLAAVVAMPEQTAHTEETPGPVELAPVGSIVDDTPPPAAADIDTSALVIEATGSILDDQPPPPPPQIDTQQLSVAAVGEDVSEAPDIAEPEIDISALSAAEPGAIVDDSPPPPVPQIETGHLSVAAVGEDVAEAEHIPPARIDTSQLSLDQESRS